ncbi:MAG: hypothetical protein Q9191_005170 [Dirinaria sp. TL-2023a]
MAGFSIPLPFLDEAAKLQLKESSNHLRTVSAEPIHAVKVKLHARGSQSLDLANPKQKKIIDQYDTWTAARAALSAKKRKQLKHQSSQSVESVSCARHLCSKCQTFPLQSCLTSPEPGRIWTSPLKRLIWHQNDCPLCSLLTRSLCQPQNDPLMHPTVSVNLPENLRKDTMQTWLTALLLDDVWLNTKVSWGHLQRWPFAVQETEAEKESAETDPTDMPRISSGSLSQGFVATTIDKGDKSTDTKSRLIQATSPCYVAISNNSTAPGLLDVKLWGYPRGKRTQIMALSSFRLRIESEWPIFQSARENTPLSYGHILDSDHIDLSLGRMWLDHCEQSHGVSCSKQGWPFKLGRPDFFRLIDVDDLSVVEVTGSQAWSYRYVALSYVRGHAEIYKLLRNNKNRLVRTHGLFKVFRHNLSKTVRDAISATRAFGERYLWIDSLCIVHDDEVEKRQQLDVMDRIYGNAVLTLVVADAEHAGVGISGVEEGSREIQQICEEIEPGIRMMLPLPETRSLALTPWNNRAWTFQERLMSRRLAIFTNGQLVWRCHRTVAFEDMTAAERAEEAEDFPLLSMVPQMTGIKSPGESYINCSLIKLDSGKTQVVRSAAFKEYASLVTQYTRRRLHYPSDVLDAFAGLSHVMELCFKCAINKGLPENLLDTAILWRPVERLRRRAADSTPSWSWAGWEGSVKYEDAFRMYKDDWTLKRIPSHDGTEPFRPLLRWFVPKNGGLQLINGNGLGVPLQTETENLPKEWDKHPPFLSPRGSEDEDNLGYWNYIMDDIENMLLDSSKVAEIRAHVEVSDLPETLIPKLSDRNLIFRTSCTEALSFGRIKRSAVVDPKIPLQYPILQLANTRAERQVGHLRLDGDGPRLFDPGRHSLIVISEALYFNISQNDQQDDREDFPLYNVMLIEWKEGGPLAERLGLGRVYKHAWKTFEPPPVAKVVVLG